MTANTNVQNVKLGACNVSYGGTDLGLTKGGVEVTITTNKHEVTVDQFGQSVVNDIVMGRTVMVKVPMAESDLTKLQKVIPGATLVTDGTTPTKKKLTIETSAGTSLYDTAQELVLHPTAAAAGDHSEDVTIPLASPGGNISFSFQVDQERVYAIEFTGYPDADGLLIVFGDESAAA